MKQIKSKDMDHSNEQALQELLTSAPADQLYQTIQELFFVWLIESPDLPHQYKQMTEDVYFLLEFFRKVKEASQASGPPYKIET